ncbi:MAG: oligosaccharide flippase family protein, partial [Verrucomicrobia bacterium]|nr:oligosaccharide flippase family protein [Verrucomicrobiota bacterium]
MSRTRRYVAALGTGYIALVVNVICVGVSIPMALHFLNRQEFGLWSVVLQITGYLALLDLGVGQSVARLLVDSKDNVNGGTYGSILKLAALVFAVQASLIALFGLTCGQMVADLMRIPPALSSTFRNLMLGQCLMMAFNFIVTPINLPLWSHQRVDIGNINNVVSFLVNLMFLWLGFVLGLRAYSLLLAYSVSSLVTFALNTNSSLKLKLLPDAGHWGKLDRRRVFEVFAFGRDLFVTNLAGQLISASQIVLVSRFVSLDAAAIWAVCMKSYSMAQQLIFRLSDFSAPGFSEMVVRG